MGISSASSKIKSIQRGVIVLSAVASNTATVTAVNTGKAMLNLLGRDSNNVAASPDDDLVKIVLTNSTTITASRSAAVGFVTVSYELVEFY